MFPKLFVCAMLVFAAMVFFGGEANEVSDVEQVTSTGIGGPGSTSPKPVLPVVDAGDAVQCIATLHHPIGGVRVPRGEVADGKRDELPDIGGTQGVPRPFFLDETSNSQSHEYHPEGQGADAEIL